MTNTSPTPDDQEHRDDQTTPRHATPSLDVRTKHSALDAEMEHALQRLQLETLETRGRDALDFHEIPVSAICDLVRHAFESGYRDGLHSGYRQGRSDACDEARGKEARTQPRNPDLVDRSTTDPTT
jgi:hypothetical protein